MLQRNIANRYANALFALARDSKQLEKVEADFPGVAGMIQGDADLHAFLTHPAIIPAEKKKILKALFGTKVNEMLYDFLCLVVDKKREAYIPFMCEGFIELLMEHRNRQEAEVDTPYELPAELSAGIAAKLEKITGKSIIIRQVVEPKLIGGIRIRLGDRVMDGSVVARLRQMKEALQSARV